ncbi:MAG: DNA topoisomerase IV subunit A [Proteobacteria bacterium]|nr:DNA topoisomerase IV subunit A [Burkholderiales bacterium]
MRALGRQGPGPAGRQRRAEAGAAPDPLRDGPDGAGLHHRRRPEGDSLPLSLFAEHAYLSYAMSVVKGRALPDVCDGQKPVQRRILYAMRELGLAANAKPVKSARIVGEVLGKLHPHGDQSAYDAMVRLAQDFTMRYPLVEGHGNFGSRDGDGAAAMRYTEARLAPIAELLLAEIDQGTVDFIPNYDGAFREPTLLPARLPMLLLNGASGIAVGLATEMPSHNLREVAAAAVALIRNPKLDVDALRTFVPGPDFPGGAQIISSDEDLRSAYDTGRGSLKVRARWIYEELARAQWQVVITELPPGVSVQKVLSEIEEATNPKVRTGKKTLTQEQSQLKQLTLSILDKARDESSKDSPVRLVLEPRSSRIDREDFINTLLVHTGMESSVSVNLVTIGRDGRPQQKSLRGVLGEWIEFRFDTVRRRCTHRLAQVDDRIHVLEGRMLVLLEVDAVIRVIRNADDPKPELMAAFALSERQAEDILEMRLRQLARLEGFRIEQELADKRVERAELAELLANPASMKKLIVKEIEADAKRHGDARRTLIQTSERASVETVVVDDPVTVIFSSKGWVRARTGHGHDWGQFTFKEGDALQFAREVRTVDQAVFIDTRGRAYAVPVAQLPGARTDGVPAPSLLDVQEGARVTHMIAGRPEEGVLLSGSGGYGFACTLSDMLSRIRAGKQFMGLASDEEPLKPMIYVPAATPSIAAVSGFGRLLVFPIEEFKQLAGGGRGVIAIGLDDGERLAALGPCDGRTLRLTGIGRGGKAGEIELKGAELAQYFGRRARKGLLLPKKFRATGIVV